LESILNYYFRIHLTIQTVRMIRRRSKLRSLLSKLVKRDQELNQMSATLARLTPRLLRPMERQFQQRRSKAIHQTANHLMMSQRRRLQLPRKYLLRNKRAVMTLIHQRKNQRRRLQLLRLHQLRRLPSKNQVMIHHQRKSPRKRLQPPRRLLLRRLLLTLRKILIQMLPFSRNQLPRLPQLKRRLPVNLKKTLMKTAARRKLPRRPQESNLMFLKVKRTPRRILQMKKRKIMKMKKRKKKSQQRLLLLPTVMLLAVMKTKRNSSLETYPSTPMKILLLKLSVNMVLLSTLSAQ
jgi:hypothetical protein